VWRPRNFSGCYAPLAARLNRSQCTTVAYDQRHHSGADNIKFAPSAERRPRLSAV
jgi:hypothetical protein